MLGITDLPTYLVGLALIIVLPGPNSLYVLSAAARRGVRDGYRAAGGVVCGDTVLMVLAAGGAASLLQASPVLFSMVKLLGACYLTWLALGLLRSAVHLWKRRGAAGRQRSTPQRSTPQGGADGPATPADGGALEGAGHELSAGERPFRRALVASLLNPKAILFFVSFFVQFVDPGYAYPVLSFVVLGLWAQLFSITYLSVLIFAGARLAAAFRRRVRLQAGASAAAGTAFLGFAVQLSVSSG